MLLLVACVATEVVPESPVEETAPSFLVAADLDEALPAVPGANLVVVFVDTLRADHLPIYGYGRDTMPKTADEPWVAIEGMHAVSSWTGPTTGSALTGLAPYRHGVTSLDGDQVNGTITAPTFLADLGDAGWTTAIFTANGLVGEATGMSAGVDHYVLEGKEDGLRDASNHLALTLDWIDGLPDGQRFAAWVQPMDMHSPYSPAREDVGTWSEPDLPFSLDADHVQQEAAIGKAWASDPEGTREQVTAVYDEQLLGVDRALRTFLDGLQKRGLLEDTVVVFAADHGETLDDAGDGAFGHMGGLRYSLLDVPFLVRVPGAPAARLRCAADSTDVAPTLLTLLGEPVRPDLDGRPLQEGCRDVTAAAFWNREDQVTVISVIDPDVQATRQCDGGREDFYDVAGDAHGVPQLDEVADAEGWTAELDVYAAEIAAARPWDACLAPL